MPKQLSAPSSRELRILAKLATLYDGKKLPFGIDALSVFSSVFPPSAIIDIAGVILAGYMVVTAYRLNLSQREKSIIMAWFLADVLVSFIPVVGDVTDIFLRSHRKIWDIIAPHVASSLRANQPKTLSSGE